MKLYDLINLAHIADHFTFYGGGKGGGGGSSPKAAPPAPSLDSTSAQGDIAAQQMAAAMNRGRTATMVTGGAGLSNTGTTSKTLLGS